LPQHLARVGRAQQQRPVGVADHDRFAVRGEKDRCHETALVSDRP
jgi:hypothetical protein